MTAISKRTCDNNNMKMSSRLSRKTDRVHTAILIIVFLVVLLECACSFGEAVSLTARHNQQHQQLSEGLLHAEEYHRGGFRSVSSWKNVRRHDVTARSRKRRDVYTTPTSQDIVDEHNRLRRLESASNMQELVWNPDLALLADNWVQKCEWDLIAESPGQDSTFSSIGQNLYSTGESLDPLTAVRAWYDQRSSYLYDQRRCLQASCANYTQLVWAESRYIGCATTFCSQLVNGAAGVNYMACLYGPSGDVVRDSPYRLGQPCTQCPGEAPWCRNGLCAADCPGGGCVCTAACSDNEVLDTQNCQCSSGPVSNTAFVSLGPGEFADVVFLLDSSGSVGPENWMRSLNLIKTLAARFSLRNVAVGVVTFFSLARRDIYLGEFTELADLSARLDELTWLGGASNFAEGLMTVRTETLLARRGNRLTADNLVIMITDGRASALEELVASEGALLRAVPYTKVLVIGVSPPESRADLQGDLQAVASQPYSKYVLNVASYTVFSEPGFLDQVTGIIREVAQGSALGQTRTTPPPEVTTTPATPEPINVAGVDVVFLMDSSGSVGYNNWVKIKQFTKRIITAVPMGPDGVNFAFVSMGSQGYLDLPLGNGLGPLSTFFRIDKIRWTQESTNIAGGLRTVRQDVLPTERGKRPGVPTLVVVLVDGPATAEEDATVSEGVALAETPNTYILIIFVTPAVTVVEMEDYGRFATKPLSLFSRYLATFDELVTLDAHVVRLIQDVSRDSLNFEIPTPPPPGPDMRADVIFVLDSSFNVGPVNWNTLKDFAKLTMSRFPISADRYRFAFVSYGGSGRLEFNLDAFSDEEGINGRLNGVAWRGGEPALNDALAIVSRDVLSSAGDRPRAVNIIVIVTQVAGVESARSALAEVQRLHELAFTEVLVVGITDLSLPGEVADLASRPGYVIRVSAFSELLKAQPEQMLQTIIEQLS